jgi:pyridoxine 5-phosphate synthase
MRFFVNIDHVATVREARRTDEPDPVRAAVLAELGGADGITVHLREDRRHIQDRDVRILAETLRTPMNLELAVVEEIVDLALRLRPHQVTVVPERREEITTEGGLDVVSMQGTARVATVLARCREAGIRTSVFIDPDPAAVDAAVAIGADAVEFHTGEYANHRGAARAAELGRLAGATDRARAAGLDVHAGHGLTYENVSAVAAIEGIEELNIGHSIISRAMLVGMREAVSEMASILRRARRVTP